MSSSPASLSADAAVASVGGGASSDVPLLRPLLSSVFAGSATTLGGLAVFVLRRTPPPSAVAASLAFAAGVMAVVSLLDLYLPACREAPLSATLWLAAGALGSGALARARLPLPGFDTLVLRLAAAGGRRAAAAGGGGAAAQRLTDDDGGAAAAAAPAAPSALRLGALMCAVLSLHNLPEGAAVMVAGGRSRELGLLVAAAIFTHNIAEGVCVAVPVLAGTGDRWLALALTAASGASEPLGALLGYLLLRGAAAVGGAAALEAALGAALCAVAGIMLYIAAAELLPEARRAAPPGSRIVPLAGAGGAALILLCTRLA